MITRFPNWPQLLTAALEPRWREPHEWGRNDCALLACDAALAITGVDLAAPVRDRYRTEQEARALLADLTGGGGLAEYAAWVATAYGLELTSWERFRRGDIGFIETPDGGALGIVWPSGRLTVPGKMLPSRMAIRGWKIG
jgi:hypothetical protein